MTIHAYHGTKAKFDKFDFSKIGTGSGTSGAGYGLYFTTDKGEALTYGPVIYTVNLTLKQQISNHDVTLKFAQIKTILDYLWENYDFDFCENFDYNTEKAINNLLTHSISDTEIIGDLVGAGCQVLNLMKTLTYFGFTHTEDKIEPDDENMPHYIIYDDNCISILNIENTKI